MLPTVVAIGVFGLFHPRALDVEPWGASRVEISCAGKVIEGSARVRITSDCVVTGVGGGPVDFVLSVPGRIRRHYQGTLRVTRSSTELTAVVTMALEVAVASTVAAESPAGAGAAMLEAQAIVTRSYFAAGVRRHGAFDFCDTTHCQFVKDPPLPESAAGLAAVATAGRVLQYRGLVIAAFYAARCEGLLVPLPASGALEYPYFAVQCEYCVRHPAKTAAKANARPHHHGMCQMGAQDLARQGWNAARILAQYYPGAELR